MLLNAHTFKVNTVVKESLLVCLSKSVYYSLSEEPNEELGATPSRDTHPHSDGEQSPSEKLDRFVFYSFIYLLVLSLYTESVSADRD